MATHTIKTNLKGIKKWAWEKNLSGFFSINGKELSDKQIRTMVNWAIDKGYEYDSDIPEEELIELVDRFLCEVGQWINFKSWIENQGYTMKELGFPDDED